jgi:hypothetical protein
MDGGDIIFPKRRLTFSELYGVISQRLELFISRSSPEQTKKTYEELVRSGRNFFPILWLCVRIK